MAKAKTHRDLRKVSPSNFMRCVIDAKYCHESRHGVAKKSSERAEGIIGDGTCADRAKDPRGHSIVEMIRAADSKISAPLVVPRMTSIPRMRIPSN